MIYKTLIVLIFTALAVKGQDSRTRYFDAFEELKGMLNDSVPLSFKRAVFITENAYLDQQLSYSAFETNINFLANLCRTLSKQNPIVYNETDREEVNKYAAVFRIVTDSVKFTLDSSNYFTSEPFRYDFDDFWGEKRWEKMFVTKLLSTHSGNCHSLPFLYKILCEELDAKAYLAMAPNHMYIKHWAKKTGWYNTELTSRYFPIDAWIMASGYIHLSAVQNRVYMDTLSQRNSIAVCLVDLAKGYERKFPSDLSFSEMCANEALKYYPNYTNALLLKAELTKRKFEVVMKRHNAKYPSDVFKTPEGQELYSSMEKQYNHIHQIGFRTMPKEMYVNWLSELSREKEKYIDNSATNNLTKTGR